MGILSGSAKYIEDCGIHPQTSSSGIASCEASPSGGNLKVEHHEHEAFAGAILHLVPGIYM